VLKPVPEAEVLEPEEEELAEEVLEPETEVEPEEEVLEPKGDDDELELETVAEAEVLELEEEVLEPEAEVLEPEEEVELEPAEVLEVEPLAGSINVKLRNGTREKNNKRKGLVLVPLNTPFQTHLQSAEDAPMLELTA
jgi:hypothetical protein